ncbi:MAG: Hsp70 family protein [Chloroflexi bacterium CFX7]|nr:Hsp70 family protein [Chloroflexi bacterium CFX7]
MGYVIGVDVGTTYTAAAVDANGRQEIFQLGSHAASIPSVVLLRADGEVLTGEAAERRAQTEPARTAREFKRRLGDPVPLLLGGTPYGAEALYAHLLRSVVDQVVTQRGEPPALVVVTHPASYGPYKLDLLRQAVRQAGIEQAVLLSEPEAAAVHYADQERLESGAVVAVYDFGGGTFDAAVLRKTADGFELLGEAEGLERLGGIDFDQAVLGLVNSATGGALEQLDPADPAARAAANRLREECRQAKEALSSDTEGVIPVLLPSRQTEVRLTREEFEEMVRPRLRETTAALERAIRSAGLKVEEVDRVLLVGGSSRIPLVGALVREATGRPTAIDAHPKHAIALGAAIFGRAHLDKGPAVAGTPAPVSAPAVTEVRPPALPPEPVPAPAPATAMAFTGAASGPVPTSLGDRFGFGAPPRRLLLALGGFAVAVAVVAGLGALLLDGRDLLRGLLQRLADRCQQRGDRLFPLRQLGPGLLLMHAEVFPGEAQEGFAVAGEGIAGQAAERRTEAFLGLGEDGSALSGSRFLAREAGEQSRLFLLELCLAAPGPQRGPEPAEQRAQCRGREQCSEHGRHVGVHRRPILSARASIMASRSSGASMWWSAPHACGSSPGGI